VVLLPQHTKDTLFETSSAAVNFMWMLSGQLVFCCTVE
jgi:hypothetical protein